MTAPISNGPTTTRLHHYAGHYFSEPGQALRPPTGTAARLSRPRSGLQSGGAASLCVASTLIAHP